MTSGPYFWTTGNTAKAYCLQWIANEVEKRGVDAPLTILDMGSGTSGNFAEFLQANPKVGYIGVEPYALACEAARKLLPQRENIRIVNDLAYDLYGRVITEPVDIVVSFSVMEHVVQRPRYLQTVYDCLKEGGTFLINYDAGHFNPNRDLKEKLKTFLSPWMARLGMEGRYQKFVPEQDFRQWVQQIGFEIVEAKSFNTQMKGLHKRIPSGHQQEHQRRWLEYEEWLNENVTDYSDADAFLWLSRNFILRK
ncbi:MAG: class I SAM-dependent methyltransferase [Anaerolineae bacterium]|nr:class I SAM-dependent methyltransferase [Anaerolineae bacterium]